MKYRPIVLCDPTEERSGLPERLRDRGCNVETKPLPSGDYLVSAAFAIERKSARDFADSLLSGKLLQQLHGLAETYEYGALLIEGDSWEGDRKLPSPLVGELYHWISMRSNLSVLYSPSLAWSARLLADLATREQTTRGALAASSPPPARARVRRPEDILFAFPGVGPRNAERFAERFGNLREVVNATEPQLGEAIGLVRGSRLHALLGSSFQRKT
jgi:DNA excision repair protein ERCC-4